MVKKKERFVSDLLFVLCDTVSILLLLFCEHMLTASIAENMF